MFKVEDWQGEEWREQDSEGVLEEEA